MGKLGDFILLKRSRRDWRIGREFLCRGIRSTNRMSKRGRRVGRKRRVDIKSRSIDACMCLQVWSRVQNVLIERI